MPPRNDSPRKRQTDTVIHVGTRIALPAGMNTNTSKPESRIIGEPPPPPPPTGSEQEVASFSLINADTDQIIPGYENWTGGTLNLADIGTSNLSVIANTDPSTVGSVRFALDGNSNFKTESSAPYAIAGDSNGDYLPWTPSLGAHTLTATQDSASR